MSEDGQYWWDGEQWQAVGSDGSSSAANAGAASADPEAGGADVGQLSEDGQYRWDGTQWQPAGDGGAANDGDGANNGDGVPLPAEVHDVLANFRDRFPELANLAHVNDHDQYMTEIVGVSVPTED
jgi:hypothetical protein